MTPLSLLDDRTVVFLFIHKMYVVGSQTLRDGSFECARCISELIVYLYLVSRISQPKSCGILSRLGRGNKYAHFLEVVGHDQ